MNYSEHGTTVDNVLYSCDFSEKTPVKEQPLSPLPNPQYQGRRSGGGSGTASCNATNTVDAAETEVEVPPLIQKIRAVVDKRRGVERQEDVVLEPCKMAANIGKVMKYNLSFSFFQDVFILFQSKDLRFEKIVCLPGGYEMQLPVKQFKSDWWEWGWLGGHCSSQSWLIH